MRKWVGSLALALLLVGAPPAAAAIDLGIGDSPAVVVDPAGTAHIVFNSAGGETYCRLPRGAKACDVGVGMPLDGRSVRGPLILRRPADGLLVIVQGAGGTTWARYSTDGGATWQGPLALGTGSDSLSGAAFSPDGSVVWTLDPQGPSGLTFQGGLFAAPETRSVVLEPASSQNSSGDSSDARIVTLADGRLVTADFGFDGIHWREFGGGDPYDINTWATHGTVKGATAPELATGPRGTYLLDYRGPLHQDHGAVRIRSFDAKRGHWRAPRWALGDRLLYGATTSLFEDAGGRLHLVGDTRVTGKVGCVVYTRTTVKRSSWFGRATTLFRTSKSSLFPEDSVVAANAQGRGVAVWQDADAARAGGHVRVARLRQKAGRYRPIGNEFHRPSCTG
jgi:hypothetical protein